MKLKIGGLIVLFLLVSGCSVEYNLRISTEGFAENTRIITNINDREVFQGEALADILSENINVAVSFRDDGEYLGPGVITYGTRNFRDNNNVVKEFSHNFPLEEIYLSNMIRQCYHGFSLTRNNHVYTIRTDGRARCFETYNLLRTLTINIDLADNYNLIFHNADQVRGNTFTWVVNRNNFESRPINLTYYDADQVNFEELPPDFEPVPPTLEPEEPANEGVTRNTIVIVLVGLASFIIILGVLIRMKQKSL